MKRVKKVTTKSNRWQAYLSVGLFAVIGVTVFAFTHAAPIGTLSLSPANATVSIGSNITVTVTENSATTAVNAVQANLTYDTSKLQFVGISSTNTGFPVEAENTGGNGSVHLARGTVTGVTGQQTIATVTFKTTATGSAAINFAGNSVLLASSDNTNILATATGGTYTVADTSPPTTPTGLTAPAQAPTSVTLNWNPSSDNVAVTGYNVYRNGVAIATSPTTSYISSGLSSSQSYNYTVQAYDAAGNQSSQSSSVSVGPRFKAGDANGDGFINITDLSILASNYGKTSATRSIGDLNADGIVNITDLSILCSNWGK